MKQGRRQNVKQPWRAISFLPIIQLSFKQRIGNLEALLKVVFLWQFNILKNHYWRTNYRSICLLLAGVFEKNKAQGYFNWQKEKKIIFKRNAYTSYNWVLVTPPQTNQTLDLSRSLLMNCHCFSSLEGYCNSTLKQHLKWAKRGESIILLILHTCPPDPTIHIDIYWSMNYLSIHRDPCL